MIYISGAPGTGKTTLATQLAKVGVLHTDEYLDVPHDDRPKVVAAAIAESTPQVIEGCEVDRLIKHGLIPEGGLLLCTGFESSKPGCAGLSARAKKYFEMYEGPKYLVYKV
jgi:hypothetical protein